MIVGLTPRSAHHIPMNLLRLFKPSLAYAALVFGVGFVMGTLRVFLVVPRLGVRWAELLEAPFMLLASFLAARVILRRWGPFQGVQMVALGLWALAFMLLAEIGFVVAQGLDITEYVTSRDPVSGPVYLLSLVLFAAMPFLASRRGGPPSPKADDADGPRSEVKP